ncbi:hypothetical protein D3C85_1577400 [compost metagenome]
MHHRQIMLLVQVVQLRVVVARTQRLAPHVIATEKVELVGGGPRPGHDVAPGAFHDCHVFAVGRVALAHLGEATGVEGQTREVR